MLVNKTPDTKSNSKAFARPDPVIQKAKEIFLKDFNKENKVSILKTKLSNRFLSFEFKLAEQDYEAETFLNPGVEEAIFGLEAKDFKKISFKQLGKKPEQFTLDTSKSKEAVELLEQVINHRYGHNDNEGGSGSQWTEPKKPFGPSGDSHAKRQELKNFHNLSA